MISPVSVLVLLGCGPSVEECGDATDNDGDGLIDCADQDCWSSCDEACGNGVDDDGDGQVDCDDLDCSLACVEACDNGIDDDGDGFTDCADPDCTGRCREDCTNGADDDGDFRIDCGDEDCRAVCDADADGWNASSLGGFDCDDFDIDVHPEAEELPYNGKDDDCDPSTPDDDLDGDGFALASDCDDTDAAVYPGAPATCGNQAIDDCDGGFVPDRAECFGERSLATADAKLLGTGNDDWTGFSVASGDLNGDGLADLVIGAHGEGSDHNGAVYLVHGPVSGTIDLSQAEAKLLGESEEDWAGYSVATADTTGNGRHEVVIGTFYDDSVGHNAGLVYVVDGRRTGTVDLKTVDRRMYAVAEGDYAGIAVDGAGDVDGDGVEDVLVGAIQADTGGPNAGAAYVAHGPFPTTGSLLQEARIQIYGDSLDDNAGCAVAGAGDLDGDGRGDLLVGSCLDDSGGENAGTAYVFVSPPEGAYPVAIAQSTYWGAPNDATGSALAGAGDVDGDGLDDVLVASPGNDSAGEDAGSASLFLGPYEGVLSPDAELLGEAAGDRAGTSLDGAGDLDGDGRADLVIAGSASDAFAEDAGVIWVVFGPVAGTVELAAADVRLLGEAAFDFAGQSVRGIGDSDGDGFGDLFIGAPFHDGAAPSGGAAYLLTFGF